ncbi:ankyrin repeat domain-containing protein, partial [Akkermansiaceae bacterium]|nr:ankyrin repeat domain-containing protein [Akkermansiaceae bacterium]
AMDPEAKAELLAAVKKGDPVVVKQSLAKGADVNAKLTLFDETALHLAASEGHKEIVELLIVEGADVNRQSSFPTNDGSRRTPLDNARSQMYGGGNATPPSNLRKDHRHHKFKAIADILRKHGGHSSSIFVAVKTGDVVGVKTLLNGEVDFTKTSTDGRTPLHLAAEYGHKEIASLLLRKGAQVDSGNWSDKTALHYAAEKGHIEIIELLLSKGANVNALGGAPTGTPLDFATHFERTKAAAFLREKKAKTGEEFKIEGK